MKESVGQPLSRVDGRLKVTGRATYAAEYQVPNIAHAVLITSTIPNGKISAIDTSAAERIPGVLAVMTHKNAPKLPSPTSQAKPGDRKLSLLQDDRVYYDNQPIGVVIAETLESAMEAAKLVRVDYAARPNKIDLDANLANAYAPAKAGGRGDPTDSNRGNFGSAAMANAAGHIEHVYSTPVETHNPMEPHATIAVWDAPDKLKLYDATQGVFSDRERVAMLLGLKPDNVRVISRYLGGGFGSKGPTWSHVVLAAMAARHVNRPVKLVMQRKQMFGSVGWRPRTRQTIAAGASSDGLLLALRHDTVAQTSSFDEFTEPASLPARMLYACPNVVTTHRLVKCDIGTPSFMRAPGFAPGSYGLECALDELAYELKMDPLAFREKIYAEKDPEKNLPWSSKSLRECYRIGAERFQWNQRKPEPRSTRDGNVLVGWGMATSVYPTHRMEAAATARIRQDGMVLVESGTQDLGTGTYTVMTQIAADALGMPPEKVSFRLGDTEYSETPISGGSQTCASTGSAVHLAARALRDKLIGMAVTDSKSPLFGVDVRDVTVEDGRLISTRERSRTESYVDLMGRSGRQEVAADADAKPGAERDQYSMYAFGAQFAEVRVDADLGRPRVSRLVGVFGAGKILNAKTARSQFIGGMVFGIGMALYENTMFDARLGRVVNNNLAEYLVPVNADVPAIEALWVDEKDEHVNPIGVKGIGEIGTTGAVAAVANAVYHATGKRVRDLPITLDKLL